MIMKILFQTIFGSRLYGTNLPESDTDYKGIFVPSPKDLVLQNAPRTSINVGSKSSAGKNTSTDTDIELFTLQSFLTVLLKDGQTNAVEMLFAPRDAWTTTSPEWEFIAEHRNDLIHSGTSAFVGYCKTQAAKYCVKGNRVAAAQLTVEFLRDQDKHIKLEETPVVRFVLEAQNEDIKLVPLTMDHGNTIMHLEVCDRKCPVHFSVQEAFKIYDRVLNQYGDRAKKTLTNDGVDYKALMHAVRIADEAEELLTTGHITLPRPNCEWLKQIRTGCFSYETVQVFIEERLDRVLAAHQTSKLQRSIDLERWTQYVESIYSDSILAHYTH